jgi:spore coat protein A
MKKVFTKLMVLTVIVSLVGAGFMLQSKDKDRRFAAMQIPGGTLNLALVPKYVSPLVKPPVLPRDGKIKNKKGKNADYYEIAVRQFNQQILPPGFGMTTVWSYGPANDVAADGYSGRHVTQGGRYFYPAFTLENKFKKPTVVKWINGLEDANGNPLQHLLPVDPTLHWANPIGNRDRRPPGDPVDPYWSSSFLAPTPWSTDYSQPMQYVGPVPMVTHVHGAHTTEDSDGYAEAWYLPAGSYGLTGVAWSTGTFYDYFMNKYGLLWDAGTATFSYPNDQRATTLWYHDHTLGMTRVNVYAGPAGFYLIRGGSDDMVLDSRDGSVAVLPGPAPGKGIDPFGTFYEIPIAIQDRSFNADGSLYYPDNRAFFEGLDPAQLQIPFTPDEGCDTEASDVAPIWQPEFFGNTMVVNGQTWPYLDVEQRRYRFRLLNGCNSRFLILDFSNIPGVEVWQIGAEGGFLAAPVDINAVNGGTLLMGPAERADVIVDFTNVALGNYILGNLGPDEPFGGGIPGIDFAPADPDTTGQVMQFRVLGPAMGVDNSTPSQFLQFPMVMPLPGGTSRIVTLNEEESKNVKVVEDASGNLQYDCTGEIFGPAAALLGTLNADGTGNPLLWMDGITENPNVGTTETWEIYNFTADAHPIHVHLVQFQVVDRQLLEVDEEGVAIQPAQLLPGTARAPEAWEVGWKDTVIAYPGEVTRIKMRFDLEGFYVWHCHIVEHEDNEMMRPYHVGPIPADAPAQGFTLQPIRKR